MKIDIHPVLTGENLQSAWQLYERQFAPLADQALQRHLMIRAEFACVCADTAVEKWTGHDDDGNLIALATYTNILTAMPLISPAYFARRWPGQYAAGEIWYCGFVCVDSTDRTDFVDIISKMYAQAAANNGVIALDYCSRRGTLAKRVNRLLHGLAVQRDLDWGPACDDPGAGYRDLVADTQTFHVYETHQNARAVA